MTLVSLLKTDPEQPIVIPFTYSELFCNFDSFFLRNRFRDHFYTRDLFSFLSPLKKDLYFFGRSELIQELVNRHRSGGAYRVIWFKKKRQNFHCLCN